MDLIAVWQKGRDEFYDAPSIVRWADGTTATEKDYLDHIGDTYFWVEKGIFGREMHLCPDVVAIVRYDPYGGVWEAKGYGVETTGISVSYPMASDDQIAAALNVGHMTYRVRIVR